MLLLSEKDIRQVVSMDDMIEAVKKAFVMMTEGTCEVPLRTVIDNKDGRSTFLFMPAYAPEMDAASLKVVNIFPGNINKGLSSAPGQILLIDGETGYIEALIDGTCVTQLRTSSSPSLRQQTRCSTEAKSRQARRSAASEHMSRTSTK